MAGVGPARIVAAVDADGAVLRTAGIADANGLAHVHVETWRTAYRGLLPASLLDRLSVARRAEQWREWLSAGPPGDVVLAEAGSRVIGFVWVGEARDEDSDATTGELLAIYVLAEHWGSGIGRALHASGIERLRERGYVRSTLWVLADNARARRFYEREGWSHDGVRKVEERDDAELVEVRYARGL